MLQSEQQTKISPRLGKFFALERQTVFGQRQRFSPKAAMIEESLFLNEALALDDRL